MTTNYRGRTVAALCGLAVVGGAVIGHALLPRDVAAAGPVPATTTPSPFKPVKPSQSDSWRPPLLKFGPSNAWLKAGPEQRAEAYSVLVKEVNANQTCMRDVQHSYRGLFADTGKEHQDTPSKLHPGEHHEFGEFEQGVCDGPSANADWSPVDPLFAEALAQDATVKGHDERYFRSCLFLEGDTTWIVCPDGYWTGS